MDRGYGKGKRVQLGVDAVVACGTRCWLALSGHRGPLLVPMAYWSDGDAVWMWMTGRSMGTDVLMREPRCAVYVGGPDGGGALLRGRARIHSLTSPRSVIFHGVTSAAAVAVLVARAASDVLSAPRIPRRILPVSRVAVRIAVDQTESVGPPPDAPGIAPPLPMAVPPDVRRALSGRRDVVVAAGAPGTLRVAPARWGPSFALSLPAGAALPDGTAAAVAVEGGPAGRPAAAAGLRVSGEVVDGRLHPDRVSWWVGTSAESAEVPVAMPGRGPSAITLPD